MPGNYGQKTQVAAELFGSAYLRDYRHAEKIFRSNSYQNSPKFKFLFHTQFEINPEAYPGAANINFGVLVRDVKLPSFAMNTHIMNQYNRKRLVQTKIKYEPVTISFFDDNANTINKLWYAYYTYYYRDGVKPELRFAGTRGGPIDELNPSITRMDSISYNERTQYKESITGQDDWGYIGETSQQSNAQGVKIPFFKNITVFAFNQHDFTAYTFVNPLITNFAHDTFNYDEGAGIMKNTMTIDYETVVYNIGSLDGRTPSNIITTFGTDQTYDKEQSPINNEESNGLVLGQGGLKDADGGSVQSLSSIMNLEIGKDLVKDSQIAYATNKNLDLNVNLEKASKIQYNQSERNEPSLRNAIWDIPTPSATPGPLGTAGSPTIAAITAPTSLSAERPAGSQINGSKNSSIGNAINSISIGPVNSGNIG